MSKEQRSNTAESPQTAPKSSTVEKLFEKEQKQGFRGVEVDQTPNENYTVQGVTSGKPTPETDAEAAKNVRMDTGLGLSPLEAAEREKKQRGEK